MCSEVAERLAGRHEVTVLTSAPGREALRVRSHRRFPILRALPLLEPGPRGSLRAPRDSVAAARTARRVLAEVRPELVFVWNGAGIPQSALRVLECGTAPTAYSVAEHWFGHIYRTDQFLRHLYPGDRGLRYPWALLLRGVNRLHPALRLEFARPVPAAVIYNSRYMLRETPVPPTTRRVLTAVSYPATRHHERFAAVERRPAAEPTLLFMGRLEPAKAPDTLLLAADDLRRRHGIGSRVVLAGGATSAQQQGLEELAARLGMADQLELTGRLEPDALAARLASAHAVVVPSRWEEPFGMVATEAALARVPVVAARSGGLLEALHEDAHALFFDVDDHAACADALAAVVRDADATRARVEAAYVHASAFTSERHLDEMEAFVDAAVAALAEDRADGSSAGG